MVRIPNESNRKQSEPLDRLALIAGRDVSICVVLPDERILQVHAHPAPVDQEPDRQCNSDAPEKIRNSVKWIHLESPKS